LRRSLLRHERRSKRKKSGGAEDRYMLA
jgi:hypothetical protein